MTWTKEIPANPVVAVAGATGAVGNEFLEVLHDLDFPAVIFVHLPQSVLRVRSFLLRAAARFPQVNLLFRR